MAAVAGAGGPVSAIQLLAALAVVSCAAVVLPDPDQRARYLEQWQADMRGAADLGLSSLRLALGIAGAAARIAAASSKGPTVMHPIGPLALALRRVGGSRALLLGGIALLITG